MATTVENLTHAQPQSGSAPAGHQLSQWPSDVHGTPPPEQSASQAQGVVEGEGCAHPALLPIGGHHPHLPQRGEGLHQLPQARGIDAIIVGGQYSHPEDFITAPPRPQQGLTGAWEAVILLMVLKEAEILANTS